MSEIVIGGETAADRGLLPLYNFRMEKVIFRRENVRDFPRSFLGAYNRAEFDAKIRVANLCDGFRIVAHTEKSGCSNQRSGLVQKTELKTAFAVHFGGHIQETLGPSDS